MELASDFESFKDCVIIVEGKRDVAALKSMGFERVFEIHKIGLGVRERVEQIVWKVGLSRKFCVLTDFDDVGKKLHAQVRVVLGELGAKVDLRFRRALRREGVSHLEGVWKALTI